MGERTRSVRKIIEKDMGRYFGGVPFVIDSLRMLDAFVLCAVMFSVFSGRYDSIEEY